MPSALDHLAAPAVHRDRRVGVAERHAAAIPTATLERADKALHHAKQQGRNPVWSHAARTAAGLLDAPREEHEGEWF